ncbi:transposase [Pelagibacterium sediminicola]|uniref:transposase n=1 Tax=Pelagibacterium sediminicola TaxID=2248761 RepID=UPI0018E54555|nr:transposase [Pelagibacterium sediminicola]
MQLDARKNLRLIAAIMIQCCCLIMECSHGPAFAFQPERPSRSRQPASARGFGAHGGFRVFSALVVEGLSYGDGSKDGRPSFDPVAMFKILILQAQHNLSDAHTEFMIRDRLSWMRFLGFSLGDRTPDENTIRHFRNRMTETGTLKRVMKAFDWQLHRKGYIPMSGQIVDASLVPAPKQRNTDSERDAIKSGKTAQAQTSNRLRW